MGVKQLICGSLNGIRIRKSLPQPYMPWTGMQVHRKVREPEFRDCGARAAVDYRETDQGDGREEIVVGNAGGGNAGSHGSKAILLSHT